MECGSLAPAILWSAGASLPPYFGVREPRSRNVLCVKPAILWSLLPRYIRAHTPKEGNHLTSRVIYDTLGLAKGNGPFRGALRRRLFMEVDDY